MLHRLSQRPQDRGRDTGDGLERGSGAVGERQEERGDAAGGQAGGFDGGDDLGGEEGG